MKEFDAMFDALPLTVRYRESIAFYKRMREDIADRVRTEEAYLAAWRRDNEEAYAVLHGKRRKKRNAA